MKGEIEEIERIEKLVDEGKADSATLVNHIFQLWLKKYFDKQKIKVEEDIKKGLKPSITILNKDGSVFSAWQNVDPNTDLLSKAERRKIKAVALHVYSKVLLPRFLFISNGRSLFLYNKNLEKILLIESLKNITPEEKKQLNSILKQEGR